MATSLRTPQLLARGPGIADAGRGALARRGTTSRPDEKVERRRRGDQRAARARLAEPRRRRGAARRPPRAGRPADPRAAARRAGRCAWSRATRATSVAALCVTRDAERPLARRPPRGVAVLVGRALGARRRRRGRRRRDPGRHARARAARGVERRARARARRGARPPAPPARHVRRPGLAARRRRGRPRRRARRVRVVAGRHRAVARRRPTSRCAAWPRCSRHQRDHVRAPQVRVVRALDDLPDAARRLGRPGAAPAASSSSGWPTGSAGS